MPRIKLWIDTGFVGKGYVDYIDFDDEGWAELPDKEKEEFLEGAAGEFLQNHVSYGAAVVDEE